MNLCLHQWLLQVSCTSVKHWTRWIELCGLHFKFFSSLLFEHLLLLLLVLHFNWKCLWMRPDLVIGSFRTMHLLGILHLSMYMLLTNLGLLKSSYLLLLLSELLIDLTVLSIEFSIPIYLFLKFFYFIQAFPF